MHQGLRFGVAQPDIEFQRFWAIGSHHEAGVEESGEVGRVHSGVDDRAENVLGLGLGEDGRIAIGAHAAGVRALVAIEYRFVIACWR